MFDTFILIISHDPQGCSHGRHSNVKPEEPLKPEFKSDKGEQKLHSSKEIIYQGPKSAEALEKERPRYTHSHVCSLSFIQQLSVLYFKSCITAETKDHFSSAFFKPKILSVLPYTNVSRRNGVFTKHFNKSLSIRVNAESVCGFFSLSKECNVVYLLPLSSDEPKSKLKVKVSPSLAQILEKMELSEREKQEKIGELMSLITPCAC